MHLMRNVIKINVLTVFSVSENIGLPGSFVKIWQKIIPQISIFWSRIQDTAVKGLCSWSQPACKTLTLNYTRQTPISRSRDPTGQSLYYDDEIVHLYQIRWSRDSGGHVTSSTRCILFFIENFSNFTEQQCNVQNISSQNASNCKIWRGTKTR